MLFTSESVTSGHPDKICDKISDSILDACLLEDPESKVAVDCWVKGNQLGIIGELNTSAKIDFEKIARKTIFDIGYNRSELGFSSQECEIFVNVSEQSKEIYRAVQNDLELGAGDQGLMFGMACNQTPEFMPLPIILAHRLAQKLEIVRKEKEFRNDFSLRPDAKTQVTIEFDEKNRIRNIQTILISSQHSELFSQSELRDVLIAEVIRPVILEMNLEKFFQSTEILINPSGSFIVGGPVADSGLTGRKIVVDGYGGWGRVGGGAFSGKDATKVDRSGAYMARFLARQVVARGWASECEIQLSYAIGQARPVSLAVFGDLLESQEFILKYLDSNFDLRPRAVIDFLDLKKPIYSETSCYGHFGRSQFSWEKVGE